MFTLMFSAFNFWQKWLDGLEGRPLGVPILAFAAVQSHAMEARLVGERLFGETGLFKRFPQARWDVCHNAHSKSIL